MKRNVALLMGGWSAEREVSLSSGKECAAALKEAGYNVNAIDVTRDLKALAGALMKPRPDVVFNALHGRGGEDGTVQGVLEILQIPYTHSGVLASAVAMNKPMAKAVFAKAGLPVAEGVVVTRQQLIHRDPMPAPFVVKPTNEGSSVGVRIVRPNENSWREEVAEWKFAEALVERFIPGREITVAVMDDRALGALEIRTRGTFYDYTAKYAEGGSEHLMPAPIHPEAYDEALDIALRAHRALGCRGVSRADLRYDDVAGEPGRLYLLEVNT
ncbi:MAG: D-alanine--D-alanine ligase, partial [Alphaproteobacteria bacterium]|nr:D-alanine--D-alanine ligase [Alphaproteobacteria bacterium]